MSEDKMIPGELIRETTKRYAEEHDLCGVVDEYLTDLGLDPICGTPMTISVRLAIQADISVIVNDLQWKDMDEERQKAHVLEGLTLGGENLRVDSVGDGVDLTSHYASPELAGVILEPTRDGVPIGYMARYSGRTGRVKHYYPISGSGYSLCGRADSGSPRMTSNHGTGEICANCQKRGDALNA